MRSIDRELLKSLSFDTSEVDPEAIRKLLDKGADANAKLFTWHGLNEEWPALPWILHRASSDHYDGDQRYPDLVRLLLERGADPDFVTTINNSVGIGEDFEDSRWLPAGSDLKAIAGPFKKQFVECLKAFRAKSKASPKKPSGPLERTAEFFEADHPGFAEETVSVLVMGRATNWNDGARPTVVNLKAACCAIQRWREKFPGLIVMSAWGDYTHLEDTHEPAYGPILVGVEVARSDANDGPSAVPPSAFEAARAALAKLPKSFWSEMKQALSAELKAAAKVYLGIGGPLAAGWVAQGEIVDSSSGATGELHVGTTRAQEPQSLGVRGKLLLASAWDAGEARPLPDITGPVILVSSYQR